MSPRAHSNAIVTIALITVALLAFWAFTVYQKREARNDVITLIKDASDDLRASFKAHAASETAPRAEAEARAATADARVKTLRGIKSDSMRPLSDAADDYLVTVREILRRDADMAGSGERLSSSLRTFSEHMQADRGMRTWPDDAVRMRKSVVKELRDHRIAVESYAVLVESFPASQLNVAARIEPVLLIEEKTMTAARAQVLDAFARAEKDITRLTRLESYRTAGRATRPQQEGRAPK